MTDALDSSPVWSDESLPISDIAGRAEFSRAIASRINRCGAASTVFGVVGPWGSGKTTLLRDIVGQLSEWKIVWFSPWSVADIGSITAEFVSALAEAFPDSSPVKSKLARYARFGTPALRMIPVVGDVVASVAAEAVAEFTKRPAWHSEFGKLSDAIEAQGEKVLVIVDDVDRLDAEELRSLLRVVRLLGRFTNVHYLMAYDHATIDGVLGSIGATGESSEFMEKIVQYPFEIPPTPMVVRRRWSREILNFASPVDAAMPTGNATPAGNLDHREQLVKILAAGLETPRAAGRLREQMRSLAALVADAEVDAFDFTALTWLRIAHHRVWDDIRLHPKEYLSWQEDESEDVQSSRMERVQSLVGRRGHVKPVQDAVNYLFQPMGIEGALSNRRWRIQRARYFERYFQVGIADDDVSERLVERALKALAIGNVGGEESSVLRAVILDGDPERSSLAIEIADSHRRGSSDTSHAMLEFVESILSELTKNPVSRPFVVSAMDRWLTKEAFLALETKLLSGEELIAHFGYVRLVESAYVFKRTRRLEDGIVKRLYSEVVRRWVDEVRQEPLAVTLARAELISMTSFCVWIADVEDHRGFLASRVATGVALIDAASTYVSYNEWVGSGTEYEVVFREQEFRFAVDGALDISTLEGISPERDAPDYEVSDRARPDLTDAQRRDFATRALLTLDLR